MNELQVKQPQTALASGDDASEHSSEVQLYRAKVEVDASQEEEEEKEGNDDGQGEVEGGYHPQGHREPSRGNVNERGCKI
mmetsp:Transcript_42379/g.70696  ORF Transcript_42379/g.70696 Transcript_42379/m.70696 type:complete len:80 (+) Transcript_42379:4306-4545(+)